MAKARGFSSAGLSGGGGSSGGKRSTGGGRLQQASANSGVTGGRGVNRTGPAVAAAHMNAKTTRGPASARRLGSGTPRPGKLP